MGRLYGCRVDLGADSEGIDRSDGHAEDTLPIAARTGEQVPGDCFHRGHYRAGRGLAGVVEGQRSGVCHVRCVRGRAVRIVLVVQQRALRARAVPVAAGPEPGGRGDGRDDELCGDIPAGSSEDQADREPVDARAEARRDVPRDVEARGAQGLLHGHLVCDDDGDGVVGADVSDVREREHRVRDAPGAAMVAAAASMLGHACGARVQDRGVPDRHGAPQDAGDELRADVAVHGPPVRIPRVQKPVVHVYTVGHGRERGPAVYLPGAHDGALQNGAHDRNKSLRVRASHPVSGEAGAVAPRHTHTRTHLHTHTYIRPCAAAGAASAASAAPAARDLPVHTIFQRTMRSITDKRREEHQEAQGRLQKGQFSGP